MNSPQVASAAPLVIADEVARAQRDRAPIVALETAVLTHGLPRESWRSLTARWPRLGTAPEWLDADAPLNLAAVRGMIDAVRQSGAVPAVTAIIDGALRLGVTDDELCALADARGARKVARRDLAAAQIARASGGTTVSASLAIARAGAVQVFATGGIGGVHRGWQQHPDISADLPALAEHALCVVSSGAKSILDIPATLEALETLSIPVIGYRCDAFPRFVCVSDPALTVPARVDHEREVAAMARAHWSLGGGALLVVQPVEVSMAIGFDEAERAQLAADAADAASAAGPARGASATPALLGRVAEETSGASLRANVALLRENAHLAAKIAGALRST